MNLDDFKVVFSRIVGRYYKKKGFEAFYIDPNTTDDSQLPDLTVLEELIITTSTSSGNILIYLVFPNRFSVATFLILPLKSDEVHATMIRIDDLLAKAFNRNFTI